MKTLVFFRPEDCFQSERVIFTRYLKVLTDQVSVVFLANVTVTFKLTILHLFREEIPESASGKGENMSKRNKNNLFIFYWFALSWNCVVILSRDKN